MDKQKSIVKLQKCLEALKDVNANKVNDPVFEKWRRDTEISLEHIFGVDTRHIRDFRGVKFTPTSYNTRNPDPAFAKAFVNGKANAEALFQSMIDEVQEYWSESDGDVALSISV